MSCRLIGKRMTGRYFVESGHKGLSTCSYFLAMSIEGHPGDGYEIASWDLGFGNCLLKPDFGTLRRTPWMPNSAIVICDPLVSCGGMFRWFFISPICYFRFGI
jgi:glutamine synthetase